MKWHVAPIKVLRYAICLCEDDWEAERRRVLKSTHVQIGDYISDKTGLTTAFREADGSPSLIITLAEKIRDDAAELWSTIAHESYHVACAVAESMQDNNPSEEFMAYVLGDITKNVARDYLAWLAKSES